MRRPRLPDELCEQVDAWRGNIAFEPAVRELLKIGLGQMVPAREKATIESQVARPERETSVLKTPAKTIEPKVPPKIAPRHWAS